MSRKFQSLLRWLPLLILPLGGVATAILIVMSTNGSDVTRPLSVSDYPSPPPVTFIPPTPRPTLRPTVPPAQESVLEKPLPDLTLTALDGSPIHLADFKDQIVFLNFWATWCVPCQDEMPALQKLQDEHGAEGIRVIAVTDPTSGQTEDDIRTFVSTYHLTLTVALSSDIALYQQFGVAQIPITFIIDRAGIVRYRHIGAMNADDIATYLERLAS
jgi:cytochrome c biogenesis protein CcmG/thiol:disulfide interchange protein DsbE